MLHTRKSAVVIVVRADGAGCFAFRGAKVFALTAGQRDWRRRLVPRPVKVFGHVK